MTFPQFCLLACLHFWLWVNPWATYPARLRPTVGKWYRFTKRGQLPVERSPYHRWYRVISFVDGKALCEDWSPSGVLQGTKRHENHYFWKGSNWWFAEVDPPRFKTPPPLDPTKPAPV